ncbi:hypothetical protein FRC08_006849 [Ceratobasidium sp. 394]|nr:hypothetical protein FRC08_006849 [Ceratobasidium sp. 394]KAG9084023.1 hypothetical protein FS749_005559 [Ceratobasidium sp. UAMH 11750]
MSELGDIDYDRLSDASGDFVAEDWDLESEAEAEPYPNEPVPNDDAAEALHRSILTVVRCLEDQNLRLDEFLVGLCYGNKPSIEHSATKRCRNQLMSSPRLPTILDNLHTPSHYTGALPKAARSTLDRWAWRLVVRQARKELNAFARNARQRDPGVYDSVDLENMGIDALTAQAHTHAPQLTRFLTLVGETKADADSRMDSDPDGVLEVDPSFAAVMNVHSLVFQFASRCNAVQKMLCLYFRAKHVPKSLFSLLNKCGYVMSYSWSLIAIKKLSETALARMRETVENHPIFWIYDNLRLSTPIKSQRLDRHTVTDNGTAMTIVRLPDHLKDIFMRTSEDGPLAIRQVTAPTALSWDDFLDFDRLKRLVDYDIYSVISILFSTTPGLEHSELLSHDALQPPPARHVMATGNEHKTEYYMLGTVAVDESSVDGNIQAIQEILRQTNLDSEENQKILGSGLRTFPAVGDQMTAARVLAAQALRIRDPNGYERLSFLVVVLGWLHVLINLGMSTFEGFRGGDRTMSFSRDIAFLGRTGFTMNMRKKRPDFHTNDEYLRGKLYALVRSLWMEYSGCDSAESLVTWVKSTAPDVLRSMAERIFHERISPAALVDLSSRDQPDQVLRQTILQTRDLLQYNSTRTAIRSGNVGWLEDLLPNLLIYFKGRENYNYAQVLAETMQWMRHEAPPGMSDAIRDHVWLVNTSGRPGGFYESDRLQEFNNGKQKQFGPPPQTTSWESHKEIAPAIPVLGEIAQHVEDNLFNFQRTRVHQETNMELDISRLASRHLVANLHKYQPGRELEDKADVAVDYVKKGTESLINTSWLANLATNRSEHQSLQSMEQVYALPEVPAANQPGPSTTQTAESGPEAPQGEQTGS